jgi:hypothetical protein
MICILRNFTYEQNRTSKIENYSHPYAPFITCSVRRVARTISLGTENASDPNCWSILVAYLELRTTLHTINNSLEESVVMRYPPEGCAKSCPPNYRLLVAVRSL